MDSSFIERKDTILNALIERKGMQYLTDVASTTLRNPMMLFDISGKVLAVSRRPGDELIWEQLLPEGHLKEEYTRLAESGGTFAQLLNSDEPVISKPVFCPYRVMGCRVRDRDGSIGIVALVEVEPFRDEDAELLIIICKAVLFEMLYRERTAMQVVPYFSVFKDIIEKTAAEQAIIERCRLLNLTFPKTMQLIAIKSIDLRNSLSLYFMRDTVMHSLPASAYCIIYDESLIIVMDKK